MKIIFPIILIVTSIALFFMQVNPLYTDVKTLRIEAKEYDEALIIAEELETLRTELARTLDSFSEEDLAKLDNFLPGRLDTVRIILDVDGIAKNSNIRLNDLRISDEGGSTSPGTVSAQTGLNTVGVSFGFSSTYAQALSFIQKLEKSLRLFETTSLSIAPSVDSPGTYDISMTLKTFWINR
jgi:hypothetical protein